MDKTGRRIDFLWFIVTCLAAATYGRAQDLAAQESNQDDLSVPSFSSPGGFYDTPFNLVLSCSPLDAAVVYTTDGTLPSRKNGARTEAGKPALMEIKKTSIVRAVMMTKEGDSSKSVTQTFLFPSDILKQSRPADFPENLDMDMEADFVQFDDVGDQIRKSFQRIPSVSLVLSHGDLFGPKGLYLNPKESGADWERSCSFEWIKPKNGTNRQVNCGVEIQGASSRVFSTKHGFQLSFKSQYGPKTFKGRIFEESSVKEFDSLVLRNPTHDSWAAANPEWRRNARYVNDAWAAETQRLMGHLSPQHRWVHLFLNGFYWGIYAIVERPDEHFSSSHLGGGDKDYDVFNANSLRSGSRDHRDRLINLLGGSGVLTSEIYNEVEKLLNIEAFIDYMLYNLYANNIDWIDKNYWLIGKRSENPQFQFVNWDAEILFWEKWESLKNPKEESALDFNLFGDKTFQTDTQSVGFLLSRLSQNPDFCRHFGDRAHRHLNKGGLLSPQKVAARYRRLLNEVGPLLDAESARWGDAFGKEAMGMDSLEWEYLTGEQGWLFGKFLPQRTERLRKQLRESGLYPKL